MLAAVYCVVNNPLLVYVTYVIQSTTLGCFRHIRDLTFIVIRGCVIVILSLGAVGSCVSCDFDSPCNIYLSFVTRCNTKQPSQPKLNNFGVHLHLGLLRG